VVSTAPGSGGGGGGQLEEIMHPMFVALFIKTDANDLLTGERDKRVRARQAGCAQAARVTRAAAWDAHFVERVKGA
jgi:hypothetical protein